MRNAATITKRQHPPERDAIEAVEQVRRTVNQELDPKRRVEFGQFMTPASVAGFMASLFSKPAGDARLLDAGAGVGSLTAAFVQRWPGSMTEVSAYELDRELAAHLKKTLSGMAGKCLATVIQKDFIQDAAFRIQLGNVKPGFTHAILNPPYKKIASDSPHRALLRSVGLETVNLYTGFVGLAIALMAQGGEVVAIIPRSFCNGLYYKPFRDWILGRTSLDHIHLFHSRTSAFNEDDVLQENVIIKLTRGKRQGRVRITTSSGVDFSDVEAHNYDFEEIVHADDEQKFIHVPTSPEHSGQAGVPLAARTLGEIGLAVSTGPVVDFRMKEFLRASPEPGSVPLLYPVHFAGGALEWPRLTKKPNAMMSNAETRKWLYPSGVYTVVRRFSSKEEKRRIVAHVVVPEAFDAPLIAFENHLNVFHASKHGLERDVAYGLCVFLNSTAVDDYFRRFSGHTQVNATDLRLLLYPERASLAKLGQWLQSKPNPTQEEIDRRVSKAEHGG